jgi:16S rRNA (uracil1498-N3)-methyltransferase
VLAPDDEHHLFRSLRLRPGEAITVGDGNGRWRLCRVAAGGGLEVDGEVVDEPRPQPALTIAFALTKGDRPEWVVQKLSELGVDELIPMTTRHTVVKWDDKRAARSIDRLRSVARAAAMQARLAWLPTVTDVAAFETVLADHSGAALAHPGGAAPALDRPVVLIGPEGGWAAEELAAAPATVDLGPTNLRADTAAVAAGVRLCAFRANHPGNEAE